MKKRLADWARWVGTTALAVTLGMENALARLPAPTLPGGAAAPSSNDWLGAFEAFAKAGATTGGKILAGGFMLYLGAHAAADLNAVRKGDKEWHEVGFGNVVGALIFLVIMYILNQIDTVFAP